MEKIAELIWWKRLITALAALVFTLVLTTVLYTARDFQRQPDLHWLNGGEMQVTGYLLFTGSIILLLTFVFFVVPLVLLWPMKSQRSHWYAVLFASMIWPPLFEWAMFWNDGFLYELKNIRRFHMAFIWLELIALCACGSYLVLIRLLHGRFHKPGSLSAIMGQPENATPRCPPASTPSTSP